MVTDPLRLYEICATSDGAGAAILCSKEKAKQYTSKSIEIIASALGSPLYGDPTARIPVVSINPKPGVPVISESWVAAHRAYDEAGIGPDDIDFVELPDNSAWHVLQYFETMDFCGEGEACACLDRGDMAIGGRIPVCPSGGAASFGEAVAAQGLLQVHENVMQLRGLAGPRQVEGARVTLSQVYGMQGNNSAVLLTS
jgi:acetyl-CoA acetyltransferase